MRKLKLLDERLDALMRRKAELAEALRSQREKKREAESRLRERVALVLGRAIQDGAASYPELEAMVKDLVQRSIQEGSPEYKLLLQFGWMKSDVHVQGK